MIESSLIHDGFMVTGHKAVQIVETDEIREVKMHLERIAEDTHGLLALDRLDGHLPSSGERDAR